MNGVQLLLDMQDDLSNLEWRLFGISHLLGNLKWSLDGLDSECIFVIKVDNLQTALKGELGKRPSEYKGVKE